MVPVSRVACRAVTTEAVLRDGTHITIRPMRPDDDERLVAFHARLSPETQRLRFFSPHPRLSPREVTRFTNVDGERRVALVAECDDAIVGVARFDRYEGSDDAEVAFVVEDAFQGRGVGSALLAALAASASEHGVRRLVAQTLPENRRMLQVFRHFSPDATTAFSSGVVEVTIPLEELAP